MNAVFAAEVGGTFTDVILVDESGTARLRKVPSNRKAPEQSVFLALEQMRVDLRGVTRFAHGTTVGTNALLERTGARTALVVSQGFGDVLELQREWKDLNYDLRFQKPEPLAPRQRVVEVACRMASTGEVVTELTDAEAARVADAVAAVEPEAVAVCLLNAYRNPEHELRLADHLRARLPEAHIHLSHQVAPEIREFERTSTTVLSAYVGPVLAEYLRRMDERLTDSGFTGTLLVTQCNGGLATATEVERNAAASLLSGPAAGVEGARMAARACGVTDFVTMDVGGTSTDLSLVERGVPTVASGTTLERWPLALPLVDVRTVGAGGGSIVSVEAGRVQVGPRSAGADPGPASYGRGGTTPTLTDALAVTGFLRPGRLLGELIPVDHAAAGAALAARCGDGWEPLQLADAAVSVAVAELAHQVRLLTLEQGLDPRDFWLVAYGGAGPMFAGWVAAELDLRGVVVPPAAGLLSAVGLVVAPYRRDYTASVLRRVDDRALHAVREALAGLARQAKDMVREHLGEVETTIREAVDVRYVGQGFELEVDVASVAGPDDLVAAFHERHKKVFGYHVPTDPVEVVRCRLTVEAPLAGRFPVLTGWSEGRHEPVVATAVRGGDRRQWSFIDAAGLGESAVTGPVVIESSDSTVVVPPELTARRHDSGAIIIE